MFGSVRLALPASSSREVFSRARESLNSLEATRITHLRRYILSRCVRVIDSLSFLFSRGQVRYLRANVVLYVGEQSRRDCRRAISGKRFESREDSSLSLN